MNIVALRRSPLSTHFSAALVAALALAGCAANIVVDAPREAATAAGATSTSPLNPPPTTSTSTSSATVEPPDPGAGGAGGGPACVPQPDDGGPWTEPTCADLSVLAVEDPSLADEDGDGLVEAGEAAVLEVGLRETAGVGFLAYPGVAFSTSTPGVAVTSDDWRYAILACGVDRIAAKVTVAKDVPPGTAVTITARAAMLAGPCPDAPSMDVVFEVH